VLRLVPFILADPFTLAPTFSEIAYTYLIHGKFPRRMPWEIPLKGGIPASLGFLHRVEIVPVEIASPHLQRWPTCCNQASFVDPDSARTGAFDLRIHNSAV
jgi:hypothetical protein